MESSTGPKIEEIHDDNIADENCDEELEQLIKEVESSSLADLYIKSISSSRPATSREVPAIAAPGRRAIDEYYLGGYQSKISAYDGIGKARKASKRSRRITDELQSDIDSIGEHVETILDCVKSTDQIINDVYERQVGINDTVEDLQDHARGTTMRTVELSSRMDLLEKNQQLILAEQAKLTKMTSEIAKLLQTVHMNIKCIRWGENEE